MARSEYPSHVVLPESETSCATLLDFLAKRFPGIPRTVWEKRMGEGNVKTQEGSPVNADTPYVPGARLLYYREIAEEPDVPFQEEILHADEHILVACKPHFLPVIPSGPYVTQCLLNRLKLRTSNPFLTPLNRIDRETAGIVIFSTNRDTRGIYHDLFMGARVEKHYEAITACTEAPSQRQWTIRNRLVQGDPFFRMTTAPGAPNTMSLIRCIDHRCGKALFHIRPVTGKKHQIRVHLSDSGYGILNDRYYPDLLPEKSPDHSRPLQLIARSLVFSDPLTGKTMSFTSPRRLSESWIP